MNPHTSTKNWLVQSIVYNNMKSLVGAYVHGQLIDIGCGIKPYEELFTSTVAQHIGIDHPSTLHATPKIDIFATAYNIATKSNHFDTAICNAVLEHLEELEQALQECYRVLKPGGYAIYSVPFIWHVHEAPRDFYRYSKYGLKYLFEKAGFEIVEIRALSGFWVTFGQLFVYNLYRLNRGLLRWIYLIPMVSLVIQLAAYALDRIDKTEQWTWMYLVIVRKP
jgi:SAM-dependent methyltransferase